MSFLPGGVVEAFVASFDLPNVSFGVS